MDNWIILLCMTCANINSLWATLQPFLLYFLKLVGIHSFHIYSRESINLLKNIFSNDLCSGYGEDNMPYGFIVPYSLKYLAYIDCQTSHMAILITTHSTYQKLVSRHHEKKEVFIEKETVNPLVYYWNRSGDFAYVSYHKRTIHIPYEFTTKQQEIYDNIMTVYRKKNHAKCFLYGDSDVGKTMFSYIMSKKVSGSLCDTFNPTEPSDSFDNLYTTVHPTADCPLVLLMDEIDIIIGSIHKNVPKNNKYMIHVHDKTTWNQMLDKIDYGIYPYVILMLCSNKTYTELQSLDQSYLRKGRIDLVEHLR